MYVCIYISSTYFPSLLPDASRHLCAPRSFAAPTSLGSDGRGHVVVAEIAPRRNSGAARARRATSPAPCVQVDAKLFQGAYPNLHPLTIGHTPLGLCKSLFSIGVHIDVHFCWLESIKFQFLIIKSPISSNHFSAAWPQESSTVAAELVSPTMSPLWAQKVWLFSKLLEW